MSDAKDQPRVLVVGAGIAGLTAARELTHSGVGVTVVEKESVIGGRMSTRELHGGVFDDGAQFFTIKDERFGKLITPWIEQGVIVDWFHSHLIRGGGSNPDGHPRYCGTGGMRSIIERAAEGLEITTGTEVSKIVREGDSWRVEGDGVPKDRFDGVIVTMPVPSALDLLDSSPVSVDALVVAPLRHIKYTPCLTVMATLDGESGLTEWGGLRIDGEYVDWIADNRRKGISGEVTSVTVQAMPQFSREHWDDDNDRIAELLLDSAKALLRAEPVNWSVRRWELAKPLSVHPETSVAINEEGTLLLAGDGFQGYRVEGAAISGYEAAARLRQNL